MATSLRRIVGRLSFVVLGAALLALALVPAAALADGPTLELSGLASKTYTGSPVAPDLVVTCNGVALEQGSECTVSYTVPEGSTGSLSNGVPVNAGTYDVTVTGVGTYAGLSATGQFVVDPVDIATILPAQSSGVWTVRFDPINVQGIPYPRISFNGRQLGHSDYSYSTSGWEDMSGGGQTGLVTYVGKGNFCGTDTRVLTVRPYVVRDGFYIEDIPAQAYTGEAVTPRIRIGNELGSMVPFNSYEGKWYDVTFEDNVEPGVAHVVVTFKSLMSGRLTADFAIVDFSDLDAAIADAQALLAKAATSTNTGNIPDQTEYLPYTDAKALRTALTAARNVRNNSTGNPTEIPGNVAQATATLNAAIETARGKLVTHVVDRSGLASAVETVGANLLSTTTSNDGETDAMTGEELEDGTLYASTAAHETLETALSAAGEVLVREGVTQNELDQAVTTLQNAENTFNAAKCRAGVEKEDLATAVEAASADANGTVVSNDGKTNAATGKEMANGQQYVGPEVANALQQALATAEAVLTDPVATQEEVDAALAALAEAQEAFDKAKKTYSGVTLIPIYRMYNTKTSEHLWTKSKKEYDSCGKGSYVDWRQENVAWYSPNLPAPASYAASTQGDYVYVWRLYDKGRTGDHIYLTYGAEMKSYLSNGWVVDKGAGFWTVKKGTTISGRTTIPIYRAYNPKLKRGKHHYTPSKNEYDTICKNHGWKPEGVKFYVIKK